MNLFTFSRGLYSTLEFQVLESRLIYAFTDVCLIYSKRKGAHFFMRDDFPVFYSFSLVRTIIIKKNSKLSKTAIDTPRIIKKKTVHNIFENFTLSRFQHFQAWCSDMWFMSNLHLIIWLKLSSISVTPSLNTIGGLMRLILPDSFILSQ